MKVIANEEIISLVTVKLKNSYQKSCIAKYLHLYTRKQKTVCMKIFKILANLEKIVFPCVILFLCFSVLLVLQLPRLGTNLSAFRTFVRFVLVWTCLFPLPLGV